VSIRHNSVCRCRFACTHAHNSIYYWTELIRVSVLFYQYNDNVSMMCLCMFCLYVCALFFTIISVWLRNNFCLCSIKPFHSSPNTPAYTLTLISHLDELLHLMYTWTSLNAVYQLFLRYTFCTISFLYFNNIISFNSDTQLLVFTIILLHKLSLYKFRRLLRKYMDTRVHLST
jgi:hypothetical protein